MPTPSLSTQLHPLFAQGDLRQIQSFVTSLPVANQADGSRVISDMLGETDCVRYVAGGIEFQANGRVISAPQPDEVIILTTSVSLCGTDLDLIKKAQANALPPESMGKVVGHEAAGLVVGVGSHVTNWQIGQMVCLDSHFACGRSGHEHFDTCVHSGQSCDGIVGGIRGVLTEDGHRAEPRDGYWSRVIAVPASALPMELPIATAQPLMAPSTLESLGNIYMIMEEIAKTGLVEQAAQTAFVVSGLGATGYPLAAVGTHYGFSVSAINPSPSKREFAQQVGAIKAGFATTAEQVTQLHSQLAAGTIKNIVIIVMSGHPDALTEALAALDSQELAAAQRRVCIVFGLYADAQAVMPGLPETMPAVPQRDFVFSRQHYTSPQGTEVYGVCGRDLGAWKMLLADLQPVAGQTPALTEMLNQAIYTLPDADPLHAIADALNQGPAYVTGLLKEHQALKLAANLVTKQS